MSNSPILSLPLIQPAQAQKHVTHNEALLALDAIVQLSVTDRSLTVPPSLPMDGDRHIVATGGSGAWAGQDGRVAVYRDGGWLFLTAQPGWRAEVLNEGLAVVWDGGAWQVPVPQLQNLPGVGIGAGSDPVNRLAVSSDAVLFSHAGAGHQVKVNKAGAGDTASLLFQSGWSGRAEMGLSGTDDFSIKISPDGAAWSETLRFDAGAGTVTGTAVQSAADDVTPGRLMRADYGFGPGNLLGSVGMTAGVPSGAVIERGANSNGQYVRFADGTQICTNVVILDALPVNIAKGAIYMSPAFDFAFPAPFAAVDHTSATLQKSDNSVIRNAAFAVRLRRGSSVDVVNWENLSVYSAETVVAAVGELTKVSLFAIGRWV